MKKNILCFPDTKWLHSGPKESFQSSRVPLWVSRRSSSPSFSTLALCTESTWSAATLDSSLWCTGGVWINIFINRTLEYKFGINIQFSAPSPNLDSLLSLYLSSTPSMSGFFWGPHPVEHITDWRDNHRRHHAMSAFPLFTCLVIITWLGWTYLSTRITSEPFKSMQIPRPVPDLLEVNSKNLILMSCLETTGAEERFLRILGIFDP